MGTQQFCLRWNNHQTNMLAVFDQLLQSEAFVDVTLACEGLSLKAHKMVLSACSPYFQTLFMDNPCQHPIVILKDFHYNELKAIVDFMYKGEVNVSQEQLSTLLKTAEALKVKGLAEVTGAANGLPEEGSHSNDMPSLRHLMPNNNNNKVSSIPMESRSPQVNTHQTQMQQDGRLSPASKRKRGRPRKRSNSGDGGMENMEMEMLEPLLDFAQDESQSPPPAYQAKDSLNDDRDEDGQSAILSDERSLLDQDEQDGGPEEIGCDIKMELNPESLVPMCLEESSQSPITSTPTSTPGTSQGSRKSSSNKNLGGSPMSRSRKAMKYKVWQVSDMQMAMQAVLAGGMSVIAAARHFMVPESTLQYRIERIKGKDYRSSRADVFLTRDEERAVVQQLHTSALEELDGLVPRDQVPPIVIQIVRNAGRTGKMRTDAEFRNRFIKHLCKKYPGLPVAGPR